MSASGLLPDLVLGGIAVPQAAAYELQQSYEELEGSTLLRMSNGTMKKVTIWNGKLKTTVSGKGRLPAALTGSALDYSIAQVMKCVSPRGIRSASNAITIPAARRTDLSSNVLGAALLAGMNMIETTVSLAGDLATLGTVSGAVGYIALYFPQLTVLCSPPREEYVYGEARYNWELQGFEQ